MGDVGKMDFLVSIYCNKIRSKKWTLRVAFHFVDIAICNSWLEYPRSNSMSNKKKGNGANYNLDAKLLKFLFYKTQFKNELLVILDLI